MQANILSPDTNCLLNIFVNFAATMNNEVNNNEEQARQMAQQIRELVRELQVMGRTDLLLQAITVPTLEQLRTEAARGTLRRLVVKRDGRMFLEDNAATKAVEVQLSPVHRAVYLLFLRHEEGIEFKRLSEYRNELLSIYARIFPDGDKDKMRETVDRLTNPLDNAINEKCSRIKSAFTALMDDYSATYYIISSRSEQIDPTSPRRWFRRLKVITLPRNLVVYE